MRSAFSVANITRFSALAALSGENGLCGRSLPNIELVRSALQNHRVDAGAYPASNVWSAVESFPLHGNTKIVYLVLP